MCSTPMTAGPGRGYGDFFDGSRKGARGRTETRRSWLGWMAKTMPAALGVPGARIGLTYQLLAGDAPTSPL